ncbi:MAG: hypothetical protein A2020_09225 [Lentisphaerae bacterium GWF2_45_14]|nr:MAG: hypothetical protein A2020_09225 [Lentisphaerae bacterium GWF2_45_14]
MGKKILISFFAAAFTAASLSLFAQTEAAPAPAGVSVAMPQAPQAPQAAVVPEKANAAPDASVKPLSKRKFGPGITKIPKSDSVESLGISSSRMLFALIAVLGAMVLFFWLLKKFNHRLSNFEKDAAIKVKSRIQLDARNAIVLIGVYEQEFLVGSGTNGITLISKFSNIEDGPGAVEDEEIPEDDVKDVKSDIQSVSFSEKLLKLAAAPVESSNLNSIHGDKK